MVTEQKVMKEVDCDAEATSHMFSSWVMTRAMANEMNKTESEVLLVNLADTFVTHCDGENIPESMFHLKSPTDQETGIAISKRDKLNKEQMNDPEVA